RAEHQCSRRRTVFQETKTTRRPAARIVDPRRGRVDPLHGSFVRVEEIRRPRRGVLPRAQVPRPGEPLVADGAELPDAEGRAMTALDRPRSECLVLVAVLRPDRLPEFVVVAPGRDEQEVEVLAAAMEDHEAEIAGELELSGPRPAADGVVGQFADVVRDG